VRCSGAGDLFCGLQKAGEHHYGGDRVLNALTVFDAVVFFSEIHATETLSGAGDERGG